MLLIGIDEAGYGPLLGPLCHGLSVVRYEESDPGAPAPDLWQLWSPAVSRIPARRGEIEIDDSKKVYSGGAKARRLRDTLACVKAAERAEPAFAGTATAQQLLESLLPAEERLALEEDPWAAARPAQSLFEPAADRQEREARSASAAGLCARFRSSASTLLCLQAYALSARHYNLRLASLGTKADLNWARATKALKAGLRLALPQERIRVFIDRQGGRKFYAGQLSALFEGAYVRVVSEAPGVSSYGLGWGDHELLITFQERAEGEHLPVALASLAAKFAREFYMESFNAFFRTEDPLLEATAGYFVDAQRFLQDTLKIRRRLGLPDAELVRVR